MTFLRENRQLVIVIAVSAIVAFTVSRIFSSPEHRENIGDVPPVTLSDRATTSLDRVTIQPVLSGDGFVVPGEAQDTWLIEAPVEPADRAYRLVESPIGVRARILGGPSGFDCAWQGLAAGADGNVVMHCQIPPEIKVVAGLQATMVVQLEPPRVTQALPLTAVRGKAEQGQVVVIHDDETSEVRDVLLGVSDGINIEIQGGLESSEQVLLAPIELDFRADP